jgi:2-oxoglutarate dehydrogenase E2 component (dihydrolipoamide succinyltransferase)
MTIDVPIPPLGESVTEGVIVRWLAEDGADVAVDQPLFELETEKATVEIPAPGAGALTALARAGQTVRVGEVVARIEPAAARRAAAPDLAVPRAGPDQPSASPVPPAAAPVPPHLAAVTPATAHAPATAPPIEAPEISGGGTDATPAKVVALGSVAPRKPAPASGASSPLHPGAPAPALAADEVERVPMTPLRQRIAERLRQAQATAAILTTFNEIDMDAVIALRARYKARFAEQHGVSLGFMSFFARACIAALQELPVINARIDGTDIVYQKRVHLGIAVGTQRGLVVPVVHRADELDFAGLERQINHLAEAARDNRLTIGDLSGGTFTISNGGVYGSLLSTPILNPPQSAILGMHKIQPRPVVVDGQIVARPMMYVALSYDHRLIDGAEAVTFLVRVKERIEDPSRLLLGI